MKRPLTKLGPSSRFALVLALLLLLPLLVQQIFLPLIAANQQSHQEAKLINFIDSLPADFAAGQVDSAAISVGCSGAERQAGISLIPAQGYAGAMQLYAAFGADGQLRALALAEHRETPGFIDMLQPEWFEQLVDNVNGAQTLDAVSGATVSSTGIIEALLACLAQRAL